MTFQNMPKIFLGISTLEDETNTLSQAAATTYTGKWHHIPEKLNPQLHHYENLYAHQLYSSLQSYHFILIAQVHYAHSLIFHSEAISSHCFNHTTESDVTVVTIHKYEKAVMSFWMYNLGICLKNEENHKNPDQTAMLFITVTYRVQVRRIITTSASSVNQTENSAISQHVKFSTWLLTKGRCKNYP